MSHSVLCGYKKRSKVAAGMAGRGKPVPRAFQAPVDVHASAEGQVYVFRAGSRHSSDSSDDEASEMKLRPWREQEAGRGRERAGNLLLLERNVSHSDSLNKLALQYGCKVADIKQVNNLIREQDMYALKSIKIPVKRHGLLTEEAAEMAGVPGGSQTAPPPPRVEQEPYPAGYTDFFKAIDRDIERLIQSSEEQHRAPSEGHRATPSAPSLHGNRAADSADWGIRWWNAVALMLLIGIVLPLFYVVYYKTQDRAPHVNDTVMNSSSYASHGTGTNGSVAGHLSATQ